MLTLRNVTVRYGNFAAADQVSFSLEAGQWLMLAGPNGAGKSTLIEAVTRGVRYEGEILLEGRDIREIRPRQLARTVGVLSQKNAAGYAYTVEEVVRMGRYAYGDGFLSPRDREGREKVEEALEMTGLTALRHAPVTRLSGGETQRTFLAQVFAQDPRLLLLDEPANHLDLPYQRQIFSLIGEWLKAPGRGVISVVHDLALARMYGTHAVLLDRGKCVARGTVDGVLTPENLQRVYHMDVYAWMRETLGKWQS